MDEAKIENHIEEDLHEMLGCWRRRFSRKKLQRWIHYSCSDLRWVKWFKWNNVVCFTLKIGFWNFTSEHILRNSLMCVTVPNHMLDQEVLKEHKKRTHERVLSHSSCPFCDYAFYDRSDMLTHIVINDETRQTRERYLPEHMWKLLNEVELFVFDGQWIFSIMFVCDYCGKIFGKEAKGPDI